MCQAGRAAEDWGTHYTQLSESVWEAPGFPPEDLVKEGSLVCRAAELRVLPQRCGGHGPQAGTHFLTGFARPLPRPSSAVFCVDGSTASHSPPFSC